MHFYKYIFILTIFLMVTLVQHVIHEYSHIMIAKFNGIRVLKVQWFTYSKLVLGTRVFFENEPNFHEESLEKRWGWISIAGFIVTTTMGYIFTVISLLYERYMPNWLVLLVCLFSIVFLTFDSLYFVMGSIFNFGDVIGFRKAFTISRSISILFFLLILLLNILIIRLVWYGT